MACRGSSGLDGALSIALPFLVLLGIALLFIASACGRVRIRVRWPRNISLRWVQAQQRVEMARTELREKLLKHLLTENDVRLISLDPQRSLAPLSHH